MGIAKAQDSRVKETIIKVFIILLVADRLVEINSYVMSCAVSLLYLYTMTGRVRF